VTVVPTDVLLTWAVSDPEWDVIGREWPAVNAVVAHDQDTAVLEGQTERAEVMVGLMRAVTPRMLESASRLRLVHVLGHGVDGLLTSEAVKILEARDVAVARANPAATAIAEYVIMTMVALSRRLVLVHDSLARHGSWSPDLRRRRPFGSLGGELFGATLGVVGFGPIAQETARRALAFGMRVVTHTRRPEAVEASGVPVSRAFGPEECEDFFREVDHLVLAAPLTETTRGIVDRRSLALMKHGSYLVNISRGPMLDERAVYEALQSGRLAGAAFDVWTSEESGRQSGYPSELPLHQFNVLMTPHYAALTREARERALRVVGENVRRLQHDEPLLNLVDLQRGY
jgi:phosphoglycerate dehydrogenase-like enzyme